MLLSLLQVRLKNQGSKSSMRVHNWLKSSYVSYFVTIYIISFDRILLKTLHRITLAQQRNRGREMNFILVLDGVERGFVYTKSKITFYLNENRHSLVSEVGWKEGINNVRRKYIFFLVVHRENGIEIKETLIN